MNYKQFILVCCAAITGLAQASESRMPYKHSAWESPKFIDRVNAWKERTPKSAVTIAKAESTLEVSQPLIDVSQAETKNSSENIQSLVAQIKNSAIDTLKNAYDSKVVQHLFAQANHHKKLIAGVTVGAIALYGGYKLVSKLTHPKYDEDLLKQEVIFQEEYEKFSQQTVKRDCAHAVASSLNRQAQLPIMMKNVNGILTEQSRMLPYYTVPATPFVARMYH